jgi:hypothetical protein
MSLGAPHENYGTPKLLRLILGPPRVEGSDLIPDESCAGRGSGVEPNGEDAARIPGSAQGACTPPGGAGRSGMRISIGARVSISLRERSVTPWYTSSRYFPLRTWVNL